MFSIDEAFVRVRATDAAGLATLGHTIRTRVRHDTGVPVSVGVAPTRTLAKLASRCWSRGSPAEAG
ncbi:DNA polymerase V [Propionibacterium cyclohexanicum]|uniref:DNA polymerase V n=1 Tax=Propionibacterium cyclohexanicum TaxID=64702 RepID=A0A1H9TPC9_9ACTN|nr:DNA polymerase V [Propionibacterium cyclohexanicum]